MQNEPIWLPAEVIVEHNRLELAGSGERHFVRDFGQLENALARPRNALAYGQEDVVVLAVTLMSGISRVHPFEQGNKRTGFAALPLFLRANGYDTVFDDTIDWADKMVELPEHKLTEEQFVELVRPFVVERP